VIGLVVVSHSRALADAAVDLALQMVPGERPPLRVAAGAADGGLGTDATAVAEAIDAVDGPDGVLVLMDLGSTVLSAEMALEFAAATEVRLSAAPFVEGLVAAVVRAAGGATLDEVATEAGGALAAKRAQLGEPAAPAPPAAPAAAEPASPADLSPDMGRKIEPEAGNASEGAARTARLTLRNPSGLHARPVAALVTALAPLDATVTIANPAEGRGPVPANSTIALLTLGVTQGSDIDVSATGPAADDAIATVTRLVEDGFGEL
jgi:dihydroxyacetone kinase phosphotransfer subunit